MDLFYNFKIVWWKSEGDPDPDTLPSWIQPYDPEFMDDQPSPKNLVKWIMEFNPQCLGQNLKTFKCDINEKPTVKPYMLFEKPVVEKEDEPYPKQAGLVPAMMLSAHIYDFGALNNWIKSHIFPKPPPFEFLVYLAKKLDAIVTRTYDHPSPHVCAYFPDPICKVFKGKNITKCYEDLQAEISEWYFRKTIVGV